MKPTFILRTRWRATTALCIASTMAVASASYAADWGRSKWDKEKHPNRFNMVQDIIKKIENDANGKKDPADWRQDRFGRSSMSSVLIERTAASITPSRVYKPKGQGQTMLQPVVEGYCQPTTARPVRTSRSAQQCARRRPAVVLYRRSRDRQVALRLGQSDAAQPNTEGTPAVQSDTSPPFKTIAEASVEKDMNPADLDILTTGFTGLPANSLDTRVPGAGMLAGPFQLAGPEPHR